MTPDSPPPAQGEAPDGYFAWLIADFQIEVSYRGPLDEEDLADLEACFAIWLRGLRKRIAPRGSRAASRGGAR